MIIPLPPVSLTFSTASETLNSSSSVDPQCLHHWHSNDVAPSPPPRPNPPLQKSYAIAAAAKEDKEENPEKEKNCEGKQIGGFIIGKTKGKGTFGKVKQGTHIVTGDKVAIKILEKDKIKD